MALVPRNVTLLASISGSVQLNDVRSFSGRPVTLLPGVATDLLALAADEDLAKSRHLANLQADGKIIVNATFDTSTTQATDVLLLQTESGANASNLSALTTDVGALTGTVTTDITQLKNDINANASNISSNATDLGSLTDTTTTNTGDISQLQTDTSDNASNISSNATDLGSLTGTVTTNTSDITQLQTDTSGNASNISSNTTDIGSLTSTVDGKAAKEVQVTAADATDLASALTLVNELKAKLDSMNI